MFGVRGESRVLIVPADPEPEFVQSPVQIVAPERVRAGMRREIFADRPRGDDRLQGGILQQELAGIRRHIGLQERPYANHRHVRGSHRFIRITPPFDIHAAVVVRLARALQRFRRNGHPQPHLAAARPQRHVERLADLLPVVDRVSGRIFADRLAHFQDELHGRRLLF